MRLRIAKQEITIKIKRDARWFHKDYLKFKELLGPDSGFVLKDNYPCLRERPSNSGDIKNPYFWQDLYVAKKIFENKPIKHIDIGSRIDGFVAHVASFREIEVFDIRPLGSTIPNVTFKQVDIMDSDTMPVNYCASVSCLHTIEHLGLGRYGDALDPNGHIKGFRNITKAVSSGGTFYFSVPFGVQRIEFNAHRIFGMPYLMDLVSNDFKIKSFAFIDDDCVLHENVILDKASTEKSFGCTHGCAIFELVKV